MKKQVIFIHWWVDRSNYKDFLECLEQKDFDPYNYNEKKKRWNRNLDKLLWESYEIYRPEMPKKDYANYDEWKIMFEKVIPFLRKDYILLWHSLWASFLIKYLDENLLNIKPEKVFLVAWAFDDSEDELLWSFKSDQKLDNLTKIQDKIDFYFSKDDFVILFDDYYEFKKLLPNAKYNIFEDRWHFLGNEFDELISDIKKY